MMRRARIKAVATLPVRRKTVVQDASENTLKTCNTSLQIRALENSQDAKENVTPSFTSNTEFQPSDEKSEELEATATPCEQNNKDVEISQNTSPQKVESPGKLENSQKIEATPKDVKNSQNKSPQKIESPGRFENSQKTEGTPKVIIPILEGSQSPVKSTSNRSSFVRPIPRLDGGGRVRRNSIQGSGASASESEDDGKKVAQNVPQRIRHDSMCSMQSSKDESNVGNASKLNLSQKRRMVVSESARKLAEARREFLLKHENKPPDKSKLTMYDLIYYNPVTNPMKPKPSSKQVTRKASVCVEAEEKNDSEKEAESTEMVVPQVKVGPNGQLIIDEQSLVIDQYKAQESIDRSDIIIDEDTNGSGFYKRRQKSKDWSKWETVKFYKSLNTYGTDFLLMQSTFPSRTRQELKLKYKKEEKLNAALVEKALRYQEFDVEALKKDIANVEENERRELESLKVKKEAITLAKKKSRRCNLIKGEIDCEDNILDASVSSDTEDTQSDNTNFSSRITIMDKKVKKSLKKPMKKKVVKVKNKRERKSDSSESESESFEYEAQPTRSGRIPRKVKVVEIFNKTNRNKKIKKK